jgi:hypothetical protein
MQLQAMNLWDTMKKNKIFTYLLEPEISSPK